MRRHGTNGAVGPRGATGERGPAAATVFAVIAPDGSIVESRGVTEVYYESNAAGGPVYTVFFADDLVDCALVVGSVPVDPSSLYTDVPSTYGAARFLTEAAVPDGWGSGANVRIHDAAGAAVPQGFRLIGLC